MLTHAVFYVPIISELTFEPGTGINFTPKLDLTYFLPYKNTRSLNRQEHGWACTKSPPDPKNLPKNKTSLQAASYIPTSLVQWSAKVWTPLEHKGNKEM